jgi:hypothetical protein
MNEVELSRRLGQLHLRLNRKSLDKLITEIRKVPGIESLSQPYKSWLLNPNLIADRYLTQSARKAKEGKE